MKPISYFLYENAKFTNWVKPTDKELELEYKIEYEIKPLKSLSGNAFPTVESFKEAAKKAKVISVTPTINSKIGYRSNTKTKAQIISLIKGYASYPQFRNEKTIEAIYKGFEDNKPMTMPLVLRFPNGDMRIMGGNTRMDIAFQVGATPKVLLIQIPG